ncbi:MAG: transposase [Puniceicoccaceae bacterium]
MCKSYRPRQAKASPLYQCLKASAPDFYRLYPEKYEATLGPLRPDLEDAFQQFLRCGDLTQGFMRVRCEHCEHEYLLPFTCKQRGICPTCHQRRTLDTAENIVSEICVPVPHRHWVFAIPRVLRNAFRKDPKRLSVLCKVVVQLLSDWIREQSGLPDGKVGIILAIHSFGDYLAFHPHIHIIATAGVFDGNGTFQLTPIGDLPSLKELFRHALLKALLDHHWTSQRQVTKLLGWRNSGFQIDAGEAAIGADNERARRQLSEYLLRAPLSLQKMSWNGTTKTVLYRSSRSWKTKRNFEVYSGPDFIAALSEHIPPKSFQTIRYYGYYSNKSRGMRKKARTTCSTPPSNDSKSASITSKNLSRRKRMWRTRIMDIWGYDPLLCPCCRGSMKVISTIQTLGAIRDVLVPLGLWARTTFHSALDGGCA